MELAASGRTLRSIAAEAQIAPSTVASILSPSTRRVSRIVAAAAVSVIEP